MRDVTQSFRDAMLSYGKEIICKISIGENDPLSPNQVVSVNLHYDGALLTSVMKCLDIELDDVGTEAVATSLIGQEVSVCLGVRQGGDQEYHYADLGLFLVKAAIYNADTNSIFLECYDEMLRAMISYVPVVNFTEESEITLKQYLAAIAVKMDVALGTEDFTNAEVVVDEEKYDSTYTFRDVLDEIAQATAGTIAVVDGSLCVLYPTETGEEITPSNLIELEIGESFGPVNAVVLGRSPQEDNIYRREDSATSWIEWRIDNNQIMDSHREDFIEGIYERLFGVSFQVFSAKSFGYGFLTLCDRIAIRDLVGNSYSTILLASDLQIDQGISETFETEAPRESKTDYKAASKSDRVLNRTILRVDKQDQVIKGLVTKTEHIENDVTGQMESLTKTIETKMSSEEVQILVKSEIGGINSIKTATGYTFDADGMHVEKEGHEVGTAVTHNGLRVNRNSEDVLVANSDGVNALNLTARNYLTIGKNSRFEDYDGNRTACFFVGGE